MIKSRMFFFSRMFTRVDFRLGHLSEVWLDHEWGHGEAEEDVGGRVHGLARGRPDRLAQEPAELDGQPLDWLKLS